jgi:HK97 family phage portal protein
MGLFDRFRKSPLTASYPVLPTTAEAYGDGGEWGYEAWALMGEANDRIMSMSPAVMWRTQPYLRTVVTFLARNIAQLGLHAFQRIADDDRVRVHDGIDQVINNPNPGSTEYELVYGLVADLALYDVAYWITSDPADGHPIVRLPVPWVKPQGGDSFGAESYIVNNPKDNQSYTVPADQVLAFHGWTPGTLTTGSAPLQALKQILAEQVQAALYRQSVWKRGGKVGAVLTRPADAPVWESDQRKQFKEDWDAQFTGSGSNVGGTPMLEDGMTLNRVDFSAHEMEFIEGARLALNTVASVYHINPTMIGLLDNANYSNVREFRRMLYGDTLGPILAQIEGRLNTFLVPVFDPRPGVYVEFNIEEKLQGSFEEQTAALQAAIGRPWMTANEGRALRNMPALDGGDELVTPLNVLLGAGSAPNEAPPSGASREVQARQAKLILLKARITERQNNQIEAVLTRFFKRQQSAVGDGTTFDTDRWNRELADDLHRVALEVSGTLGRAQAATLGFTPDEYNVEQTVKFLEEVAKRRASNINQTTSDQLLEERSKDDGKPASVWERALTSRNVGIAIGLGTFLAGFATHEAAAQIAYRHRVEPTKTWVTGSNPRSDHAALDGETVALDEPFSNGLMWPGDSSGDADDNANCNCDLQINLA